MSAQSTPIHIHPLEALKKNPFVLAPMAGITDHAFRSFMRKLDASVVVTELVSATGIEYKSERTLALMSYEESQRPIGIQLFGEDPEIIAKAAKVAEEHGADFVDLNFGCPVPKVVKKGAGSAMMKDLDLMRKVLASTVKAVKIPVTIKIRTGWEQNSRNALDVCNLAYDEGITWVAIHGRTRAAGYAGLADWDFITDVKAKTKIPVLGNGDILTPQKAVSRLKDSGCDGVLIGRGALKNPLIFADALSLWKGQPLRDDLKRNYAGIFRDLSEAIKAQSSEHITQIQLKKFASWFSTGYPGASAFRKSIFQLKNNDEVLSCALEFFDSIGDIDQEDTSHEEFLMGGHG
ncbi:tRNA dihydrouridine synthase DusB [Pseudobdellovibrio exovorus]|uniref:tRNA-dihydrouridine synthase n=1 Tax=Pseudobdellovibrio exovorus JSS TaxID=1184267 RepID=M4VEU3_9BACT|nr:tRNA dihydrouridine synthase DusB [Pseudobdellovibrio exovorus]AGH96551.1 transcription regulator-like protein yacF [Pseudobdellovibrio exovorus JSS]